MLLAQMPCDFESSLKVIFHLDIFHHTYCEESEKLSKIKVIFTNQRVFSLSTQKMNLLLLYLPFEIFENINRNSTVDIYTAKYRNITNTASTKI